MSDIHLKRSMQYCWFLSDLFLTCFLCKNGLSELIFPVKSPLLRQNMNHATLSFEGCFSAAHHFAMSLPSVLSLFPPSFPSSFLGFSSMWLFCSCDRDHSVCRLDFSSSLVSRPAGDYHSRINRLIIDIDEERQTNWVKQWSVWKKPTSDTVT